jgi:hypothetical protein
LRFPFLVMLLLVGAVATGETSTRPSTQPVPSPVQLSVSDADDRVKSAERDAINRFHTTDSYKQAKAQADSLEKKLKEARQHGTPQAKLDASHDFVVANENVRGMEATAAAVDSQVIEANKLLSEARNIEQQKENQEVQLQKLVKQGQIVKGMTEKDAELAFAYRKTRNSLDGPDIQTRFVTLSNGEKLDLQSGVDSPYHIDVIKKVVNERADGMREIILLRYGNPEPRGGGVAHGIPEAQAVGMPSLRGYRGGQENVLTDKMVISLLNEKVIEILGQ